MNIGLDSGTKRVAALGALWTGLDQLTGRLASNTLLQLPNLPITVVPVLQGITWLWFVSFVCAVIAEFGGFGETAKELFNDASKLFLVMLPFQVLWILSFVSLAMSEAWVWNYFQPLYLSGVFAIYFGFTSKYWVRFLRVYYDNGVAFVRWVRRRLNRGDFPDTIPV